MVSPLKENLFAKSFTRSKQLWKTADISRRHQWRLRNEPRYSILMTCPYKDLGSASDWMNQIFNQSEALTGLSIVTQTSFCEKTTGGIAKRRLFSQANGEIDYLKFYLWVYRQNSVVFPFKWNLVCIQYFLKIKFAIFLWVTWQPWDWEGSGALQSLSASMFST